VAKTHPGKFNVPYVAGMNVTTLPTNTFSVSNSTATGDVFNRQGDDQPLGTTTYTLMMWCPSLTAFYGSGATYSVPTTDKLGGFVIKQISDSDIDTAFIGRWFFDELSSG
jgi:hypothetical protein